MDDSATHLRREIQTLAKVVTTTCTLDPAHSKTTVNQTIHDAGRIDCCISCDILLTFTSPKSHSAPSRSLPKHRSKIVLFLNGFALEPATPFGMSLHASFFAHGITII